MRHSMKTAMLATVAGVLAGSVVLADLAQAAEVSLLSGLYRSRDMEVADADAGKETTINAGGRFSEQLDGQLFWFAQGDLTLRSYDDNAAGEAPSDSTSLAAGGGVRYYFTKLAENVSPFAYGLAQFKAERQGEATGNTVTDHESNGLFYGASFGIRLSLGTDFFVDLETPLFESALFATETSETETAGPTPVKTKDEVKRTELYVDTTGAFTECIVALGLRL